MKGPWLYWIIQAWVSLILIGVGVPFYLGKVRPNPWAGFRTMKTLSDESVWYPANRAMGLDLMLLGALMLASTIVMYLLQGAVPFATLATGQVCVVLGGITLMLVHTFWRLSKL